ncbi:hypothetical protein FRC06_011534 [Ceratobasidium sp. 370]|nr:hypothetical protein FRC06_011534 [Ceratobasidium sp. 370]
MTETALQPVNPATVVEAEKENEAPWVVRKLVGSMTGRMVMSSYETLKATSTSVICLSPWGDSSPLLLPCIRFRDLVVHTVIAATGGTAAIAAPVMGPIADTAVSSLGDTIAVEIGTVVAYDVGTKNIHQIAQYIQLADDLIADKTAKAIIPVHSARLETTSVKTILITLKYKHTMSDAALGFFRSGTVHADGDLFSNVKDYLSVEKPDVVFCHGPFLAGDYRIAETLLAESASIIKLCEDPPPPTPQPAPADVQEPAKDGAPIEAPHPTPPKSPMLKATEIASGLGHKLSSFLHRPTSPAPSADSRPESKPPSAQPSPALSASALPAVAPTPRRILVIVLGLSPHRKLWTTSARPGESVMNYHLLNGCPALVLPATSAHGSTPLVAWDTLTLEHMHTIGKDQGGVDGEAFNGIVTCLFEYLSLCVDWEHIVIPDEVKKNTDEVAIGDNDFKKKIVRDGLELVLAGAVRSHSSKAVKDEVDTDRAGVAMFRMP